MKNENYPTRFRKNSLPQKFKWNLSLNYFFISSILLLTVFFGETLAQTVVTFPSSSTWTAPAGVTSIQVEAWGGGGGGGGTGVQLGANAGGGGGGGAYAKTTNVTVVPLTTYTVTVSTGGTAGTSGGGTGGAGGASSFNTTTVVAAGGAGGGGSNATLGGNGAAGAGATVAASTGATKFAGGAGAAGQSSTGGGGGGSAGTASAGNAAVGAAGGVAVTGGGAGGAGTSAAGSAGSVPGGAGGGGRSAGITGTARAGGAGAAGRVVVTYTLPTVTGFGASSGCIGGSITITGTNFTGAIASGVKIGGTAVTSITSNTGTQIVAVIGSGTTGTVSVTVNGNTGTSAGTFTVNPTPVLTATPSGQTACDGVAFSGIALGSSVGGTSFSWASNSPAGIGGAPISGSASPISGTFTNSNTVATNVTFTINGSAAGCNAVPITATVTVNPSTLISSQPSAQTICQTQNATFTVGATGVGLTYQWQEQVGGAGAFNNISNGGVYGGATSASLVLTSPSLSMSTNVYQCIVTGTCGSATTSTALLTINPTPVISVSPTTQTLCADFPIADIVFSDINGASSGSSTFSYSRTTPGGIGGTVPVSGTASPISGTFTSTNSVPTTVTFTITASLGSCNAIPVTADVIVNPGVAINTQPSDQTICQTYDATFTIAVAGGGITYQWQEQVGGVGAFSDIINGGVYSGATSNALLLTNPAIGMSTNRYRCTINSSCGALTSDDKLLTINPTPAVTALPSSQTICSGSSISNIVLTDNNGLTVGSTFSWTAVYDANVSGSMGASGSSDITGTVSNTNLSSSANATYTITGTFGSCTSHPITATVTVNPQTIISVQPVDHTICETQSTSFSVTATGLGITYQWQEQIGAGAFADISNGGAYGGATTPTLTLTNPAQSLTGNHYHCVISNTGACPQVTTNNVLLTINYTPLPVATPSSQTVCSGASVNIGLTDNNPVSSGTTYSWTRNSPAGISGNASGTGSISEVYTNSNPSTSATITFTINATTPASCPAIPITATATINPNVLITSQPVSATRCSNTSSATFTVSATGLPTLTYQWQEQVGGVGAFNDISNGGVYGGATTVTLSLTNPPIGMSTNHYRCIVSGTCGPATSDGNATLIINPQPIVTVTPSPGLNCSGGGSTLTASSSVGGTSYVWSPTTALNPAAGTSAIEIASPTVATTYTVTGTATGCSGSTTVTVNVGTNPSAVTVTPVSSTICPGDVKQLTASGGTNAVSGTLLDGTVAGGFENATSTFAANGWTQVGTTAPTWFVGTAGGAQNGTKSAFYGSSATTYGTASSTSTVNHFYRDIPIPAGATNVLLNYYYKMPTVDDGFDYFYVYTGSSAGAVPSAGSLPSGYTQQFSNTTTAYSSFTAMTAINLTSFAGSTVRIIFSFQTDAASPYANPAIDNVSLTATVPPTVNPFTWSPTTGLFTNAGGTIPYTGTTTTTVYASPSSTTTYTATAANAAGCTSSGTAVVNFSTAPPTISSYSTACTGQTLTINGNNFINVTSATVGGIAATPTIVNNTQLTLTVPAGASGTNVVVTLTSNCGTATDNTLTVNTTPTVTATPSSQTICTGATIAPIVLSNTNAIPGAVISWSRTSPSGTGGTVATSGSGSSPVTISGVFTSTNASSLPIPFSYNCSANGCTSTGSATVTMSAALAGVVASASPAAVCAGSPTSLSSTAPTVPTSPILTQNFNSTPVGWTTTNSSSGGTPANAAWTLRADAYSICYLQIIICLQSVIWHSNDNSQFYMSNSDAQAGTTTSTQLTSPSFSTVGLTNASLSFWHYFLQNTSADHGRVEVSTDGGTIWTVLQDNNSTQGTPTTNSGTTVFVNQVVSLNTVLNQPNVKIRFNYTASDGWFWCIDNVSITGTPGTRTFSWTSSPAGFTSTSQNPGNATPTVSPTIYSVTTTLAGACAVSNVSVTRLPLPSVAASNDAPFCSGAQDLHLTSTAPTATSYQWTGPGGYSSASANPTITNAPSSASGNYQLKVTDSNGCKDSIITAVNIYALPSIGVTVIGSPNLCTGQTTSDLQATGAGGSGSYSWTTGETTDLITVSSAGTYIVTGTDNHSCVNTFSQVITETAAPAAPVVTPVGPVTLCFNSGGVIPVTLTCTNYSSDLLWSTSETTSGISVDYEDIFNVTYTDANGCYSVSNSVTTSFDAVLPVITCPSDVVSCSTTPALGTPTTSDNCSVASVTNDAPSVFPVGTTSVTWTVTDYNSNSATCVQQVTVNSAAVIGACPSDITQCDNHVATWTTPSASGAPTPTVSCTPASGSTFGAGTTSVTCTASNTCGSSSCSFNVTINETPIIGACPSDITTCNPVVTFSTPSATATPSATVTCVPASGSSFALGTTVVTCTATNLCGSSSCTFNISVQTPSTAATSATSNALYGQVCLNGSVILTANGGSLGTGASWVWYEGGCGSGASIGTGASITITPLTNGSHIYYVRAEGACGNTVCQSVTIDVISTPPSGTIHYTAGLADGCVGAPAAAISVNAVANCTFYNWASNQAGVLFNGNPGPYQTTTPTVNVSFTSLPVSGNSGWSICVFGGNACGNTNNVCTWVRATLSTPTSVTGSVVGCPGSGGNAYSSATVAGAASYQWTGSAGVTVTGNGSQSVTVAFSAGFISGTLSVHGQTACGYNGADRTITITRAPVLPGAISGTSYPCPSASASYSVTAVPGAATYTWTTSVAGAIVSGTTNTCTILFPAAIPAGSTVSVTANSSCPFSSPVRSKGIASGMPNVPGNIGGPASGQCAQTGVSYSIGPVANATSYSWSTTCGTIQGPNNLSGITVDWASNMTNCTISVVSGNACGNSAPRTLLVTGAPSTPTTISGNISVCAGATEQYCAAASNGANAYQWTVPAGAVIVGPSNGVCILVTWGSTGGTLICKALNDCGVSGSKTQAVAVTCRQSQMDAIADLLHAEVYPNPTTGKLTVKFSSNSSEKLLLNVLDVAGRILVAENVTANEGVNLHELDLSTFAKGIYLVQLRGESRNEAIRVTVE